MVSEERKAENRRIHRSRHDKRSYTRLHRSDLPILRCYVCQQRPHISLTDHIEETGQECVMLVCSCKDKSKWFRIVD